MYTNFFSSREPNNDYKKKKTLKHTKKNNINNPLDKSWSLIFTIGRQDITLYFKNHEKGKNY